MASVTIHSSSTVFPSKPTPTGIIPLSESDHLFRCMYVPMIYVYKPSDASSGAFENLRNSLSKVLVPFYPLTGRLRSIGGGRFELDCCTGGAQFIEASCDAKLEDYGDFAPTHEVKQFAPQVAAASIEELPLLLVQVTRFSCGGICIGINISHASVDGISAFTFINAWASIARGEKTIDSILKPCHERDLLLIQQSPKPPCFYHQEYKEKPPLLIGSSDAKEEQEKETTVAVLNLTKDQIEKLKKRGKEENPKSVDGKLEMLDKLPPKPYSTFECVAGHIWVSACKARNTGEIHQPTVVRFYMDMRRRLRSPLPQRFFGNATMITVTPKCVVEDLIVKPLSYAAGKIREGHKKFTDEYMISTLNFLAGQDDIRWRMTTPPFWGNPNINITSLISMPIYDADFGWGRPYYFRPTFICNDGRIFIFQGPDDDESLIVLIELQTRHMDNFKKFFYEDLERKLGSSKDISFSCLEFRGHHHHCKM